MKPEEFIRILAQAARLKITTRHCYTEEDRKESVADHSWRIALMAMLLSGVDEYRDLDMDKVIRMCLIHDLGESPSQATSPPLRRPEMTRMWKMIFSISG